MSRPRAKVRRTIVTREDQTFAHLSLVLRAASSCGSTTDDGGYPRILPGKGEPPPQCAPLDDAD